MSTVLDASALIASLRDEPGADVVQRLVERKPAATYAHALNLCEVYYDFMRAADEMAAESAVNDLLTIGIQERNDLDSEFWREVGRLKAQYRRVSLAGCCALALAERIGGMLASADRHELTVLAGEGRWKIEFIR